MNDYYTTWGMLLGGKREYVLDRPSEEVLYKESLLLIHIYSSTSSLLSSWIRTPTVGVDKQRTGFLC